MGSPEEPRRSGACLLVCLGFVLGNGSGFALGIAATEAGRSFVRGLFEREAPAAVHEVRTHARPGLTVSYPSNWKIDEADESYDPDHHFSIESPGNSLVIVMVRDAATDPAKNVDRLVDQYVPKLMRDPTRADFSRWGNYEGTGLELRGRFMGVSPGSLRLFSATTGPRSFHIVEMTYDEDRAKVLPAFRLIESSFKLIEKAK